MQTPSSRFIVVTGATRGLGRALVTALAAAGHRVAGCGRSEETIRALRRDPGPAERFGIVDITRADQVGLWALRLIEDHGPPDLLINNAGVMERDAAFVDIPADEFDRVIHVNVLGTARVMRTFLPAMIERGEGIVVNLSSGAGQRGYPHIAAYCTSKFAIEGLSKSVAQEVPDGIAVVPLQPGVIDTDMLRGHYGDRASQYDPPDQWARRAAPFILGLGPEHNGQSLRIPDRGPGVPA